MSDTASLVLGVDSRQVAAGAKSLDDLALAGAKAEKSTESLMRSSHAVGSVIGVLATSAMAAGGALMLMTRNAINAADTMNDMHLKTGLAFKDLAAYDLLAKQSGTSLQGVAQGFKYLSSYMITHSEQLKTIGVTSKDANTAMGQFADAIAGIQDPALKTKLAITVLQRGGTELLPMLSGGSAAFKQAREQTQAYGEALEKVAPKADQFNDSMARMAIGSKVIGLTLADKMLPTLLAVSDAMLQSSVNGGLISQWGSTGATVLKGFAVAALNAAYMLNQIGDSIGGTAAKIGAVLSGDFYSVGIITQEMGVKATASRAELDKMSASILNAGDSSTAAATGATTLNKTLEDAARKLVLAKQAADAHQKSIDTMIASLEKESITYGMTAAQVKIYEAEKLMGDSKSFARAKAAIDFVAGKDAEKKATEDATKAAKDADSIVRGLSTGYRKEGEGRARAAEYAVMSTSARNYQIAIDKITDSERAASEALQLRFPTDAERASDAYKNAVVGIAAAHAEAAKSATAWAVEQDRLSKSWSTGATRAMRSYQDDAVNVAMQTESAFKRGFKSMEDAVTQFALTGKVNIRDFGNVVLEEFYRISVAKPLVSAGAGLLGNLGAMLGSAWGNSMGNLTTTGQTYSLASSATSSSIGMSSGGSLSGMSSGGSLSGLKVPSFDGGGFTGIGTRTGGIDNKGGFPAILHPNETVTDHAQGQQSPQSAPSVTVIQNINIDSRTDVNVIMGLLVRAKDMAKSEIMNELQRGGAFATAVGRA